MKTKTYHFEVSYGIQRSRKTQEHLPQQAGAMGAGSVRHSAGACRFLSGDFLRERVMTDYIDELIAEAMKRLEKEAQKKTERTLVDRVADRYGFTEEEALEEIEKFGG